MLKRIVTIALTAVLAGAFLTSCGKSSSSTDAPATPTGSLITLVSDLPGLCDAVSFSFNVTDVSLTGSSANGQTIASTTPINSGIANPPILNINLGCLRDFTTVLNLSSAKVGTYNNAYVTLTEPLLKFYDPTILPPNLPINLAQLTINPLKQIPVTINPALTIIKGQTSVIQLDFDMLHMIQSITRNPVNGLLTVTATPEITVTPLAAAGSSGEGFGEVDDMVGFVRSVTTVPPGNTSIYNGSFNLQLLSASISGAPNVAINLADASQLYGFADLNQLVTDSFMEVDAYIDVDGNFVATSVEDEYVESVPTILSATAPVAQTVLGLVGPVTSLTRDSNGNVTSFNLWARQVVPHDPTSVDEDSIPVVYLTASTTYQYSSRSVNFANLPFGPNNITVGQEVVVHGPITPAPTGNTGSGAPALPATVAAAKVYDKLQSIQGNFGSLLQVGDDDKTGAFTFTPCAVMFQGTPALVLTSNQTNFVNLVGLSSLSGQSAQPTLLVQGLPFFEPQAQTISGVPVPAGTLVILAKQVHQLH